MTLRFDFQPSGKFYERLAHLHVNKVFLIKKKTLEFVLRRVSGEEL